MGGSQRTGRRLRLRLFVGAGSPVTYAAGDGDENFWGKATQFDVLRRRERAIRLVLGRAAGRGCRCARDGGSRRGSARGGTCVSLDDSGLRGE